MKKSISYGFMIAVLVLCAALSVGILFAGPGEAGANERLADAPALTDKDGGINAALLSDTAQWVNDHFFGRQTLISVNNWLCGKAFGVSGAEDVLLGTDGWLYYGSTLDDYTGTNTMTERELYCAARNVALMAEYCENNGKTFVFAIAPNKNSLYADHMPNYTVISASHNARALERYLAEAGVNYADLFTALKNQEQTLYFAHDSHWNSKGAALGADTINAALGRESGYFGGDFSQTQPHGGDLYEMVYPAFTDTETDPVYGGGLNYTFAGNATKPDSITLLTESAGTGSLLCYRDSFGNLLYPYLADSFGACRFSRSNTYDLTLEAEFVVIELVERNLNYLIANQPVFVAPGREVALPQASGTIAVVMTTPSVPENTILVRGTLPGMPDTASAVYIVCADGVYEATNLKDNGFGAYLNADARVTGIAYYADGALRLLNIE